MNTIGIDLGTTNTVVAYAYTNYDGKVESRVQSIGQLHNDNWEKYDALPSVVYYDKDGEIGDKKGGIIVGRQAKELRGQKSVVTNSKRFMGTQHKWSFDNLEYEAKDIGAMILQHCKRTLDQNIDFESVVITVPASFNPDQIEDTLRAAKQAGFKDDTIIIKHEPTAALLSFIDNESRKSEQDRCIDFSAGKRILVFDLGGGTCDTSVIDVKVGVKDLTFKEVAIGRYQELGGIDFDAQAATGLLNKYLKDNNILEGDITDDELSVMHSKLVIAAEKLKEKLSANIYSALAMNENTDVEQVQAKINIPKFYNSEPYRIVLTKAEYDMYTSSLYIDNNVYYKKFEDMDKNKNIITVIRKTLEDYDISKNSIDYVFLTGGMSKFPTIQQKIKEYLRKPVIMCDSPMESVAIGAAIYQHYKVREEDRTNKVAKLNISSSKTEAPTIGSGIIDTMMLAEAVLIDMNEGLPKVIIPKKTVVPYEGEIVNEFRTTSPAGIKLNIYAAENEMDSSMRVQKTLEKTFNFPVESGTPFDIHYRINENKAIEMKILIKDEHRQELDISVRSDIKIAEKDYNIIIEE